MAIVRTGFVYFATVFAFAFLLGVLRVLIIAPITGEMVAVLLEVPLVLAASWLVARRLLRGQPVTVGQRGAVGALALLLLLASELTLASVLANRSAAEWLAGLTTPTGLVGLAGQLGFAAMPLLAGRKDLPHPT